MRLPWLLPLLSVVLLSACGDEAAVGANNPPEPEDAAVSDPADAAQPGTDAATVPPADAGSADDAATAVDGATPSSDAATATGDAATATGDAAVATGDAATATDAATSGADGSTPGSDAATASGDAATAGSDASNAGADAGAADAAAPGLDAATAGPDAASAGLDAAAPGLDAASPGPDAASPGPDAATPNRAPTVTVPANYTVNEGSTGTLVATASDPDLDPLTYAWTQTSGSLVTLSGASTASASFTAPAVAADTTITFSVKVCDPSALCATASTSVLVKNVPNSPPAIASTTATPNPLDEGKPGVLGVVATDPDGDPLTYAWTQLSGPTATLTGATSANASITGPQTSAPATLTFQVQVCDNKGGCVTRQVSVTLNDSNKPPTAVITAPVSASPGQLVTLDGAGSTDPENDPLTYAWGQTGTPAVLLSAPAGKSTTFLAPVVQQDTVLTFTLQVCDPLNQCGKTTGTVLVLGVSTYVSATGSDTTGQGTKAKPWRSIGRAITTAVNYSFAKVFVDKGDYPENPVMAAAVDVECGYDSATWTRPSPLTLSRIQTSAASGVLFGTNVNSTMDGCTVVFLGTPNPLAAAALILVTDASPTLLNVTVDATDPTANRAQTLFALHLNAASQGGTATVTGGSYLGGNGTTQSYGIRVNSTMKLVLTNSSVTGGAKLNPSPTATGVSVSNGAVATLGGATVSGGVATTVATGLGVGNTASAFVNGGTYDGGVAGAVTEGIHAGGTGTALTVVSATVKGGVSTNHRGIRLENPGTASVRLSDIDGGSATPGSGTASTGVGIFSQVGSAYVIDSNSSIVGGSASSTVYGIQLSGGSSPAITNNKLIQGSVGHAPNLAGILVESGTATIDRNTLILGGPATTLASGIAILGGKPVITGNVTIRGADPTPNGNATLANGITITGSASGTASATIQKNGLIEGGTANAGCVGIQSAFSTGVTVSENVITGGAASVGNTTYDWGMRDGSATTVGGSTTLTINNNVISGTALLSTGQPRPAESGGVLLNVTAGTLTNNRVFGGSGTTAHGLWSIQSTRALVFNNYFNGGGVSTLTAITTSYGMRLNTGANPGGTFDNNIVDTGRAAFTRYGVLEDGAFSPTEFKNNDFYPDAGGTLYRTGTTTPGANTSLNTDVAINARSGTASYAGNLAKDPLFVNEAAGNYHLQATSPCKDTGLTTGAPATDMDNQARTAPIDIGPDEL